MEILMEEIQNKIHKIDKERDELEQKYYRDKIKLSTEYETKTSDLLNQKTYLKTIFNEFMDRQIEKNPV